MKTDSKYVGNCVICKRLLFDGELADKWYFHISVGLVCRFHPGVEIWYKDLIQKAEKELKDKGILI